jgi:hypothetical protein
MKLTTIYLPHADFPVFIRRRHFRGLVRFTAFSGENLLEEAEKWCGLGPKAAAARFVGELAEMNPLLRDRRRFTSAANLAKARAVALAKLTPEERSAKARAAALARYSKSQKTRGNMGDGTNSQGAG